MVLGSIRSQSIGSSIYYRSANLYAINDLRAVYAQYKWTVQLRFFNWFDYIPDHYDGSYSLTNVSSQSIDCQLCWETMSHGSGGSALLTDNGLMFMLCSCWLSLWHVNVTLFSTSVHAEKLDKIHVLQTRCIRLMKNTQWLTVLHIQD